MKSQTLGAYCAPQATPIVKKLVEKYGYTTEKAYGGNGDIVYMITTKTKLNVRYCTKVSTSGKTYVNWLKVWGPDDVVDLFLQYANYAPREKKVEQLKFEFK